MKFSGQYIRTEQVKYVSYDVHRKHGSPNSMRVTYFLINGLTVSEWVCPLHPGYAAQKATEWIQKRITKPCSFNNIIELVIYAEHSFKIPNFITFDFSGKFIKILSYDFSTPKNENKYQNNYHSSNNSYADLFFKENKPSFTTLEIFSSSFTKDEVMKNFRRLSFKCHPDHGGTSELFINLQNAKDLLLDFLNINS